MAGSVRRPAIFLSARKASGRACRGRRHGFRRPHRRRVFRLWLPAQHRKHQKKPVTYATGTPHPPRIHAIAFFPRGKCVTTAASRRGPNQLVEAPKPTPRPGSSSRSRPAATSARVSGALSNTAKTRPIPQRGAPTHPEGCALASSMACTPLAGARSGGRGLDSNAKDKGPDVPSGVIL